MAIALRAPTITPGIIHHRPPLGLHLIASFLRDRGLEVSVIDSLIDETTPEEVAKKFDFLGQSSLYHSLPEDVEWVNAAKRANPLLFAFFGGPGAQLDLNFIFSHSEADGVFQGENPEHMLPIFRWEYSRSPGFIHRAQRPAPFTPAEWNSCWEKMDWGKVPLEKYWSLLDSMGWSHDKTAHLITATHCNKNCTFCTFPAIHSKVYNLHPEKCYRTNQEVYEEIDKIQKTHPEVRQIFFHDDDFFMVAQRSRFFSEYIDKNISFIVQSSQSSLMNILDYRVSPGMSLSDLQRAGVRTLCIGVENVASRLIGKRSDKNFLITLAQKLNEHEILAYYYLILFTPDETVESLLENIEFCHMVQEMGGQVSIAVGVWALTGTELAETQEADRVVLETSNGHSIPYKTTLRVHDPQIERIRQRVWTEIDLLNSSKEFKSKQVYQEALISRIEREISSINPKELYRELR